MRRIFATLAALWCLTNTIEVQADELEEGDWSYKHGELHDLGIIDEMNARDDCCSGNECRATRVDMKKKEVYLDRKWCPFSEKQTIFYDIELPLGISAVACAPENNEDSTMKKDMRNSCPVVYCIAVDFGT